MTKKIDTKIWHVDKNVEQFQSYPQVVDELVDAAQLIKNGELVAFPTETVYGLGANALSDEAVEKIYTAKGRPSDNPLIVHIGDLSQLPLVAREVSEKAKRLMDAFWPGPLTLFLPKTDAVASRVTAGLPSVGVRMPDHPVALALLKAAEVPIAAPSANRSGRPSPTTAEHVLEDLRGRIAGIVDGGHTGVGVESTTIDMTVDPPMIHRPGGITYEQIKEVIGEVDIDPAFMQEAQENPLSPGMKYTHYAPQGELWLVAGESSEARAKMAELLQEAHRRGYKTGVMTAAEDVRQWENSPYADVVLPCGSKDDLTSVARDLYATLRSFDEKGVQFIVSSTYPRQGMGLAVMNRLEKAASGRIIYT